MPDPGATSNSLASLLTNAAAEHPQRAYLVGPLGELTYDEVARRAWMIGNWLLTLPGLDARLAVGICSRAPDATALAIWGCVHAGITVAFLPKSADISLMRTRMSEAEVNYVLTDEAIHHGKPGFVDIGKVGASAQQTVQGEAAHGPPSEPPPGGNEAASFLFQTSGTAGEPKWVCCEYTKCRAAVDAMWSVGALDHAREQNVFLTPPLFHSYGLSALLEYTRAGATVMFPRGTSPFGPAGELRVDNSSLPVTAIEGVPYFYSQFARLVRRLKSLRLQHLGIGGGAIDPRVMQEILAVYPEVTVSVRYGLTETPSVVTHKVFRPPHSGEWRVSGRLIPAYDLAIETDDRRPAAANEEGEIVVRGPCVCAYRGQQLSELRTGDIGYLTAGRELVVVGRRSAFIKYRGFRLSPEQIESVIASCAGVEESRVCVIDGRLVAQVVHPDWLTAAELLAHVAARLPVHAVPEEFVRVAAIPRTLTGKIRRHRIDDEAFLMLLRPHLRLLVASKSLTMRSNLYHLGLDSTAALNLLLDLEERLGVAFPESLLTDATFETPAALKAALDSLTNETW